MVLCFLEVAVEGLFELAGAGRFFQFGKRFYQFLFGPVDILQLIFKKLLQFRIPGVAGLRCCRCHIT